MNTQACDRCHRRKSRCDKLVPSCGPCRKAGVACNYVDHTRDRQKQVDRLQRRIKQLEDENHRLSQQFSTGNTPTENAQSIGASNLPSNTNGVELGDAEGATANNELTEEITFLSSRAGGENQFLGSTSGVLLASLVDATVKPASTSRSKDKRTVASPLNGHTPSSEVPLVVTQLPDERVSRALYGAYFEHDYLSYPFLHRPSVLETLNRAYEDPMILAQDGFAHFSFYMVLAIATASVYKFDRESLPDAEGYHLRATERLNEVLQRGDVHALQAVLLLCQYRMVNSVQDTSTSKYSPSMWHLVGVAARMCLELGLHREQIYQKTRISATQASSHAVIVSEIRRRCFWCVISMDRIVSITLGRPLAIRLQDTDVALPLADSDTVLNRCGGSSEQWPPSGLLPTAVFVHIVRYRIVCGDIMSALHIGSTRTQTDSHSAARARDELRATLEQWHHDTSQLALPEPDTSSPAPQHQSSFCTPEWYEMLYCNALLMLYRPSPALSGGSSSDPTILQSIFLAAKRAIAIYSQLHRWKRINYTWITLHAVFMAGLSYVYAVGRHFRSRKHSSNAAHAGLPSFLESDPAIIDIVNDCRTCSNVLVAISERWNMTKNCYDVFNRLSDAILADAVEYYGKITGGPQNATQGGSVHLSPAGTDPSIDWQGHDIGSFLAVDSALRDCLDDLQHFQSSAYGDDPVGQLSHDWMGEIEGMGFNLFLYGDTGGTHA
ncbi:fungal-specific transcription factor domain-containing protein [Aspergillus heterothallicus]